MTPYNVIDLEQNTYEWKEMRRTAVGASDASIIWGSPWRSPYQLWMEKMGFSAPQEETEYMRRGKEMESQALSLYTELKGLIFKPIVIRSAIREFCVSSLDGYSPTLDLAVEIKCGPKTFALAKEGKIPDYYMAQLQHQMFCLGHDKIDYFSYNGFDHVLMTVDRDEKFIQDLMKKEEAFYLCLKENIPPVSGGSDFDYRADDLWIDLEKQYVALQEEISAKELLLSSVKDQLIRLAADKPCLGETLRVEKLTRKGVVDYSMIPELSKVDLEKYRKASTSYYKISLV